MWNGSGEGGHPCYWSWRKYFWLLTVEYDVSDGFVIYGWPLFCWGVVITKSCLILCDPVNCSTPGSSVLYCFSVCSDLYPLSWWCYLTSSSADPFSFYLQSFPVTGSFPMSQLFASGGQRTGASASAPVLSMNIHSWFSLGLTGLISLQSKGLSRVFSNTTI